MAISVSAQRTQPMLERDRLRVAIAVSLAVHLALLTGIALSPKQPPVKPPPAPIDVTLTAVPAALQAVPQVRPEPEIEPEVQLKPKPAPKPPPPPKRVVRVAPRRVPRLSRAHLRGGGNPRARVVRNPSPITSRRPSSHLASNAGGRAKAAPAPPHLLTSKRGKTPAGAVGKGSAPAGSGGKTEASGGGPTYGPGVMGGPTPVYPKTALDQDWEGKVTLAVTVGANGKIVGVQVVKSSGHDALDQAAIRAVHRGWTFKPGMTKGKPAAGKVMVTFSFSQGGVSKE